MLSVQHSFIAVDKKMKIRADKFLSQAHSKIIVEIGLNAEASVFAQCLFSWALESCKNMKG
jgi:hypothetical protein